MTGPEIHPAVDAKNVQAQLEAEATRKEVAKNVTRIALHKWAEEKAEQKRADYSILGKALVTAGALVVLEVLGHFGLMADVLVQILELGALLWYVTYFGAWLQFRFGKGRLIK